MRWPANIRIVRRFLALILIVVTSLMPMSGIAALPSAPDDVQELPCHSTAGAQADQDASDSCGDMKGCCAAFLAPAALTPSSAVRAQRVVIILAAVSGFVPDQTDPPPVVL
jgi:hypothetical protein